MSERSGVSAKKSKVRPAAAFGLSAMLGLLALAGCSGGLQTEPLVEFSTEVTVHGAGSQALSRQLRAGVYLIEVRERDIDLRVGIDAASHHYELGDAFLRHGLHRMVVRLEQPGAVRVTLQSVDQRTWRGAAAVRILRWPPPAAGAQADERLLGFMALGRASELVAREDKESWRASLRPFREAAAHFERARDARALAETRYQQGWVEYQLLYRYEDALHSAEVAQLNFDIADDEAGIHRASNLRALSEFSVAAAMDPGVARDERRELLDRALARLEDSREFFADRGMATDEILALNRTAIRFHQLGDFEACAQIYEQALARAVERGDRFHEAQFSNSLGLEAARKGQAIKAVALFERALPSIERERNPDLYASIISNLGYNLITLGDFDRAQVLHAEALELFTARGDDSQTARELAALAAIQFRTGNVERALATVQGSLPLYERARDHEGRASALRLAGNAAAQLGQHDTALTYLRQAEELGQNGVSLERTRTLIASELRELGDLPRSEQMLATLLRTRNEITRADALAERARLRQAQGRHAEALADLRAADAGYARLKMDFNRIDTSSALAMALLDAGKPAEAGVAADVAVGIETRIRVNAANPEMRARFLSASYAPYEARIEVDLAGPAASDAAAVWKAFRVAEGLRARSLIDRLVHGAKNGGVKRDEPTERLRATLTGLQIDLERQLRRDATTGNEVLETRRRIDETRARLEARMLSQVVVRAGGQLQIPESREALQAELPADTAVLAYFVGDRRSHAWLLTRDELRHGTLPGRAELSALVSSFVARQRSAPRTERDPALAPLLGNLLHGVKAKRLLLLPDGPLNGLPFAALPLPAGVGGAREQLIDRFTISAAPSLALALRPTSPQSGQQLRVAVVSDPVYTPDDRRLALKPPHPSTFRGGDPADGRLARLPYSAIEARAVVRAFQGAEVIELAGFNATARRVIELPFDTLDVLHFATHAVTHRDSPEQSALFLSEYAADGSPLPSDRLTADDIARSGVRADVVVLSGCATGDGRELRGEGVLGLTYGFLANGSNTVIASLWPVEDALTARFMEEFYSAYRASGRAPDALRTAQLRTRDGAASAVWSSFVVRANELP